MAKWNEGANWTPFDEINGGQQFSNALTPEDLNALAGNIAYLYENQGENEYVGEYAGGNYRAGAIVKYSDGNIYMCIKDTDDEQEPTNATYWQMLNEEGLDISDATATAGMVISGQTFYGANGKETGTMPDYGYYATGSFFASLNTDKTYIDLNGAYSGKVYISPEELTITENGDYEASEGKVISKVTVAVPESSGEVLPEFTEVEDFTVFLDEADEGTITVAYSTPQDVKLPAPSGSASAVRLASVDDENFIPSNIKSGVSIFGLMGAYEGEDKATPIEVSTEAEMTALLTSGEVGGVYKYTGTTGTYENGALYVLEESGATVTITNTSTTYEGGVRLANGGATLSNLGKNSTITITVPIGETIEIYITSEAYVPMWYHTSLTGDIVYDEYYQYTVNGDGTIVGYMYDAD